VGAITLSLIVYYGRSPSGSLVFEERASSVCENEEIAEKICMSQSQRNELNEFC
jgi:hypothetical protein